MKRSRYKDEASILKHIEDTKALAYQKLEQAKHLEVCANDWFKAADKGGKDAELLRINGKTAFNNSKKLGKAATNLLEKKLPKLGVKLAQMRTDIMPFLPDRSIVR